MNLFNRGDLMAKVTIIKPDISEEENKRRIEMLNELLSTIVSKYQDYKEGDFNGYESNRKLSNK